MPLASATRLGPYEILSALGAGGMGEVYRARDTRLDRTVAIKILPEHLSSNSQSRERFEREAKAISSLSHPHICSLYDIGQQDSVDFLVMEYLEGETLAHRLKKGPLPLDEILKYAAQITDALDTAHRRGIVHRDLKPGNIMLTKSGAKLLDFGLAKMRAADGAAGMTSAATQTAPLTGEGTILGTLQYMAPEQLEGKKTDARTDIFALGAVVYEMATGRKAFEGASQASLIAAILERDPPPISSLQPLTPSALDHVVHNCLAKEPAARWQDVYDVLLYLKWIANSTPVPASTQRRRSKVQNLLPWTIVALVSAIALSVAITHRNTTNTDLQVARFLLQPPQSVRIESRVLPAISPDGRRVVFGGIGANGKRLLWVRSLDSTQDQPLAGTEEALFPFWSPDSRWIAFFTSGKIKKINASGGPAQVVCDAPACVAWGEPADDGDGGTWSRNGVILFRGPDQRLHRVSADGGEGKPALELDQSRGETAHFWPSFLPDGKHFLYLSQARTGKRGIYLGSLDTGQTAFVLPAESNAIYAAPGFVIYSRKHILLAQPFDVDRFRVTGEPVVVAEQVGQTPYRGGSFFSASQNGILAYRTGSNIVQLAWYDRSGRRLASVGEPGPYVSTALSPNEQTVALDRSSPETPVLDVWILEIASGVSSRMTFGPEANANTVWSPDGRELAFASIRNGSIDLYRKVVGGGVEQVIFVSHEIKYPRQWLKFGESIIFVGGKNIYRLPLEGEPKPLLLLKSEFPIDNPQVSPDGRWIAYQSHESGQWEVYVATFPRFGERRQLSASGGCQPFWRKDAKELFFLTLDGKLMAVSVQGGGLLKTGSAQMLFQTPGSVWPTNVEYCVTGDGKKFLIREPIGESAAPITVVLNWNAGLK